MTEEWKDKLWNKEKANCKEFIKKYKDKFIELIDKSEETHTENEFLYCNTDKGEYTEECTGTSCGVHRQLCKEPYNYMIDFHTHPDVDEYTNSKPSRVDLMGEYKYGQGHMCIGSTYTMGPFHTSKLYNITCYAIDKDRFSKHYDNIIKTGDDVIEVLNKYKLSEINEKEEATKKLLASKNKADWAVKIAEKDSVTKCYEDTWFSQKYSLKK